MNQTRPHSECKAILGKNTFYLFEAKIPHGTEEKINYHPILKGNNLKRKKLKRLKKIKAKSKKFTSKQQKGMCKP